MRWLLFRCNNISCGYPLEASLEILPIGTTANVFIKNYGNLACCFSAQKCLISRVYGSDSFHTKSMVPCGIRAGLRRLIVPDLEEEVALCIIKRHIL